MALETSNQLLERVRAKHRASWYGLAKLFGAHTNTIYSWKGGHTVVDKKFAIRIAELLDEPPEYVLACLEAERETDAAVRKVWRSIAAKFSSHAASILLGTLAVLGVVALPSQRVAATTDKGASSAMYIKLNRRWISRLLQRFAVRNVTAPAF